MTELDDVNIRHIKLVTGDELMAIVLSNDDISDDSYSSDLLVVQRPMLIMTTSTTEGLSFSFHEWQPFGRDDVCFINPLHVVSHVECSNEIKEQYIRVCLYDNIDEYEDDTEDQYELNTPTNRILH